jgi:competence protein ComEA
MRRNQDRTRLSAPSDSDMKFVIPSALCLYVLTAVPLTTAVAQELAPAKLPPGPGRDTLVRVCGDCHGVDVFEGQRRTRGQWREVVDDMVARGANASDDDTAAIMNYLATVFGHVNVNKASESDIATVLELASTEAAAIVRYRTTSGEFKTLDDLKKVPGFDLSHVEAKKDRITFAGQ